MYKSMMYIPADIIGIADRHISVDAGRRIVQSADVKMSMEEKLGLIQIEWMGLILQIDVVTLLRVALENLSALPRGHK